MGRPAGWMQELTGRAAMRSPGRPPVASARGSAAVLGGDRRGATSEDAAVAAGVSPAVGVRWFREAWRHAAVDCWPRCRAGTCRSPSARRSRCCARRGAGCARSPASSGRSPSTISRELRRNAATRGGQARVPGVDRAVAGRAAARRPKTAKLAANERLREYVQDRLAGQIVSAGRAAGAGPGGTAVERPRQAAPPGPPLGDGVEPGADRQPAAQSTSPMMSRCGSRTRRSTRRSTCRAAARCKRELIACLRTGRALRVPRARARQRGKGFVTAEVMISAAARRGRRPGRPRPLGGRPDHRAGPLGDRHAGRAHHPVHDAAAPAADGRPRHGPRVKNGPALAGHGAEAVRDAIAATIDDAARAAAPLADLGPGRRDGPARPAADRHRPPGLLLRPRSPGSAAPTRTPTGCCASTSPKAPTSRHTVAELCESLAAVMSGRANLCVPGQAGANSMPVAPEIRCRRCQPNPRRYASSCRGRCSRRTQRRLILLGAVNSLSSRLRRS